MIERERAKGRFVNFVCSLQANAVLFTWYGRRECLARRKLRGLDSKVRHRCRFALIPYKPSQSAPLVLSAPGATPGAASDATSTHSNAPVCVEPEHGFKSNDFLNIYTHRVHRLSNEHDSVQSTNRRSTSVQVGLLLNRRDMNDHKISLSISLQATTESLIDNIIRQLVYLQGRVEFNLAMENIAAKNLPDAVSNLRAATSHHHLDAAFNLGLCYELGMGVKKDMKMAMECYRQAARRGHIKANYNLGVFYARGLGGLKKDARAARECFVTAATMGLAEAKILVATDKAQTKAAQKSDESLEDGYQSNPSPIISNIMAHKDLWNLIMGDNQLAMEKKRDNGGLKRKKFPSDSTDEGYKSDPSPFIHSSNDELFLSLIDAKQN